MSPITLVAPDGTLPPRPRPFLRRFLRLRDRLVGLLDERLDDAQPLTRAERTRLVGELVELERQVQQRRFLVARQGRK